MARTASNQIGYQNKLCWRLKADMQYFRKVTLGQQNNAVVMGRKTFESIGKALPGRLNIVLTRNKNARQLYNLPDDVQVAHSFDQVEQLVASCQDCFVIGGAEIYNLAMQSRFASCVVVLLCC